MDFSLQSSSVIVDGTLRALLFVDAMRLMPYFNDVFPINSCLSHQHRLGVMFYSGSVTGFGYIVLVRQRLQFATSSMSWSGPSLVLKFASVVETDIHLDADIILEEAIIGPVMDQFCDVLSSISVTTSRDILVKSISLQPHEIQYLIPVLSDAAAPQVPPVPAYVWNRALCVSLKFKSK